MVLQQFPPGFNPLGPPPGLPVGAPGIGPGAAAALPPPTVVPPTMVAPPANFQAPTPPPAMVQPPGPPPNPADFFGSEDPLTDPLLAMLLMLAPFANENETDPGPVYPYWYKPSHYPKPTLAMVTMLCDQDWQDHQPLLRRFEEDYRRIHLKTSAVFSRDKRAKDPFVSTSMNNEVRLITSLVGGIPLTHEVQSGNDDLEDDAQKMEDYLDSVREDATRLYRETTLGNLQRDEAMSGATYGRFVWHVSWTSEDHENPVRYCLIDPATCFPTPDGYRGMKRLTRRYTDRLCDVLGFHDPDGDQGLREKIEQAAAANTMRISVLPDGAASPIPGLDDQRTVEVKEYWDRRWFALVVDGTLVKVVAHNYGFVPFVYQLVADGAPGFTTTGFPQKDPNDKRSVSRSLTGRPLADMGVSHIHYIKHTHNIVESVHTRGLMEIMKSANPPVVRYQTREASGGGLKPASTEEGAVNPAILGEEQIQVWPTAPAPHVFGPVLTQVSRDMATGMMPLAAFGVNEQSNVSGHALENLEDQGREKMAAIVTSLEQGYGAVAEMILRLSADWGPWMGYPGQKGQIGVYRPRPAPGEAAFFEVTPEMIRKVGIRVKCSLRHIRMETMGPLFNAASQGIQLGVLTAEEVVEMRGVRDPKRHFQRWQHEKLRREMLDHPKYKEYAIGRMLEDSPDPEDQQIAEWWAANVMNAPQQPPPGAPPGLPPGAGAGPPLPNTTAGISLPGLGAPPGPGSGPPPSLALGPGPQPAAAPL